MPTRNDVFLLKENIVEEEKQIQEYDIQQNSQEEKHFKYNIKRKKYVLYSENCNKIHQKIKRKYFKVMIASHSKQEFTCDLCKQTFTNKRILETHLFCHIGKKPFRCTTCHKKFSWRFLLQRHMKKHKTINQNKISYRNLHMRPSEDRVKPSSTKGRKANIKQKNDICNKRVRYGKGQLEIHKRTHRTHACKICGKEFKWKAVLLQHQASHSEDRPFKCVICNKSFKWKEHLKRHHVTHSDERNYVCQVCDKRFKTKGTLIAHKIVHNDKFNYTCHICNKSFKRSGDLKVHIYIHSDEYKYSCDICNKHFKTKQYLPKHKLIHCKKSNIKGENECCDICGKRVLYGNGRLEIHKRTHKTHACKICGKEFKWKAVLLKHEATHSEDRPFKCDICNKSYKRKEHLKSHHVTHTDERNYVCQVCNKRFKTKGTLIAHKIVHNNQFNHTSKICNKNFKRSED
ncbi:zinc finger protein 90-like [Centruroides sculpturatus]|uniref:zinc finger protein 90-like n=1 Tax=Centruroides sculpturatus TaxID=218467 RepID=UPI000C6E1A29|nr:zinc finger protein 90-like [Centruroides sculpturatus]